MKFNPDLASIHAYLCSDGYVVKNPETQKHKYYYIGLRNTNNVLLEDFQKKFEKCFGLKPIITNEGRCKIQSKEIYHILTEKFTYYSDRWTLPELNRECLAAWLRSYFDCDGWVELQKAKSRSVRLDSINEKGLYEIQKALERFGIKSSVKFRRENLFRLSICGSENLERFLKYVGFLHPKKDTKLKEAENSYKTYEWDINERNILETINEKGKERKDRGEIRLLSIDKNNLKKVNEILNRYEVKNTLQGPWTSGQGSKYYCLIFKKSELEKIRR